MIVYGLFFIRVVYRGLSAVFAISIYKLESL